jgi:hypothetical protein
MEHVFVAFDGTNIDVFLENPGNPPLPMLCYPDESYTPPANILDDKGYSSQFGWQASGAWAPPAGTSVWIRVLDSSPGLETYEGGRRFQIPIHTFAPLFGTASSGPIWQWPGTMVHNWYAAANYGNYQASYEVYFGDTSGNPDPTYGADTITLSWSYVPEPAAVLLLGAAAFWAGRRR